MPWGKQAGHLWVPRAARHTGTVTNPVSATRDPHSQRPGAAAHLQAGLGSLGRICSGFNNPLRSTGGILKLSTCSAGGDICRGKLSELRVHKGSVWPVSELHKAAEIAKHSELLMTEWGLFTDVISCLVEWKHLRESQIVGGECIPPFLERKWGQILPWLGTSLVTIAVPWHLSLLFFLPFPEEKWVDVRDIYKCIQVYLSIQQRDWEKCRASDSLPLESVTSILNRYSI